MSVNQDYSVVTMRFDNAKFEKSIKQSTDSLDKFRQKLNFKDEIDSFDDLEDRVDRVDMSRLEKTTKKVSLAFNALQVAAASAIATITNKVVNTVSGYLDQMSAIKNISNGWATYEQQVLSTQTILNAIKNDERFESEAEAMDEVVEKMKQLQWFADETSYSLEGMTSGLGKFLSAGVELDTAINAVQGVSVWAAYEGQNAAVANNIMTQLAQTLSRNVMTQDWSSVETANMASKTFKERVLEIASSTDIMGEGNTTLKKVVTQLADGTEEVAYYLTGSATNATSAYTSYTKTVGEAASAATDANKVTVDNFRSMLSSGFFTGEMLALVLQEYGKFATRLNEVNDEIGDGAPIMTKWRKFFTAFEEAGKDADTFWKLLGDSQDISGNAYSDLQKIYDETGLSQKEFIAYLEELTSDEYEFSRAAAFAAQEAKTFTEAIQATQTGVKSQWARVFEYIFGNYLEARELFTQFSEYLYDQFVQPVADIADVFENWKDAEDKAFQNGEKTEGGFNTLIQIFINLAHAIGSVINPIKEASKELSGGFDENKLRDIINAIEAFTRKLILPEKAQSNIKKVASVIMKAVKVILGALKAIFPVLVKVLQIAFKIIEIIFEVISGIVEFVAYLFGVRDATEEAGEEISAMQKILEALEKTLSFITTGLDKVKSFFSTLIQKIEESETLSTIVHGLADAIAWLITKFGDLIKWGNENGMWEKIGDGVIWLTEKFEKFFSIIKNGFSGMTSGLSAASSNLSATTQETSKTVTNIAKTAKEVEGTSNKNLSSTQSTPGIAGLTTMNLSATTKSVTGNMRSLREAQEDTVDKSNEVASTVEKATTTTATAAETIVKSEYTWADALRTLTNTLALNLLTISFILDRLLRPENITALANSIVQLAVSLFILRIALKPSISLIGGFVKIGKSTKTTILNGSSMWGIFGGIAIIIAELIALVALISQTDSDKVTEALKVMGVMGAFVAGLMILVTIFVGVSKAVDTLKIAGKAGNFNLDKKTTSSIDNVFFTLLGVAAIIGSFAAMMGFLMSANVTPAKIKAFSTVLNSMAICLGIIFLGLIALEKIIKGTSSSLSGFDNIPSSFKSLFGNGDTKASYSRLTEGVNSSDFLFLTVIGVAAIIAAFAAMMSTIGKQYASPTRIEAFSKMLHSMALCLLIIFGGLAALEAIIKTKNTAKQEGGVTDNLFLTMLGVAIMLNSFAAMMGIIALPNVSNEKLNTFAAILVVLTIALTVIFGAIVGLEIFANKYEGSFTQTYRIFTLAEDITIIAGAMSILGLSLIGMAALASQYNVNGWAIAGMFALISTLIGIIGVAIWGLCELDKKFNIENSMKKVIPIIGGIMLVGLAMSLIGWSLVGLTATLGKVGLTKDFAIISGVLAGVMVVMGLVLAYANKVDTNIGKVMSFCAGLILMTTAIALLGHAISVMSITQIPWVTDAWDFAITAGALIVIINSLAGILMVISGVKTMSTKKALVFSVSVVLMAGALAAVGAAMVNVAKWDWKKDWGSLIVAGLVMVALIEMAEILGNSKMVEKSAKGAASVVILAASLLTVAYALQALKEVGSAWDILGLLSVIMGAIIGLGAISKLLTTWFKTVTVATIGKMAAMIGTLATLFVALGYAAALAGPAIALIMTQMKEMDAGQIAAMAIPIITLTLAVAGLGLALWGLGKLISKDGRVVGGVAVIALALTSVGVAIYGICAGIAAIITSVAALIAVIPTPELIHESLGTVLLIITETLFAIPALISACSAPIVSAFYQIINMINAALIAGAISLVEFANDPRFINFLIVSLFNGITQIIKGINQRVIPLLIESTIHAMQSLMSTVLGFVIWFVSAVFAAFKGEAIPSIHETIQSVYEGTGLQEFASKYLGEEKGQQIADAWRMASGKFLEDEISGQATDALNEVKELVDIGDFASFFTGDGIGNFISGITDGIVGGMDDLLTGMGLDSYLSNNPLSDSNSTSWNNYTGYYNKAELAEREAADREYTITVNNNINVEGDADPDKVKDAATNGTADGITQGLNDNINNNGGQTIVKITSTNTVGV